MAGRSSFAPPPPPPPDCGHEQPPQNEELLPRYTRIDPLDLVSAGSSAAADRVTELEAQRMRWRSEFGQEISRFSLARTSPEVDRQRQEAVAALSLNPGDGVGVSRLRYREGKHRRRRCCGMG